MIFSRALLRPGPGFPLAVLIAAVLGPAPASMAGFTLGPSDGTAFFSLFGTSSPGSSNPQYNSLANGGALTSPGGGLPFLSSGPNTPNQTTTQSTLLPSFTASSTAGNVPSGFGTSTIQIFTSTSGQDGGTTTQGGVFWSVKTSLVDGLTTATSGLAAVSVSTGMASFTNPSTSGQSITILPGAILSVNGTVNASGGSYVAAGLSTFITLSGGAFGTGVTSTLDAITLAAGGGQTIASTGFDTSNPFYSFESASVSLSKDLSGDTLLTGTGTSFAPAAVTLTPGETITVEGVLTLISDPGSSIGIASGLAPGFSGPIPEFGVYANTDAVAVPEPSTVLLVGAGLAMAGLWSRSSRRRTSAAA